MMKFASFETVVEMIYHRLPGQKSDYGKAAQTGVSFAGGYIAGILCAIVRCVTFDPISLTFSADSPSVIPQMSWSASSTPIVNPVRLLVLQQAESTRTLDLEGCGTVCPSVL